LAGSERKRERGAGPRLSVGEKCEHASVLVFDGLGDDNDFRCAAGLQREPSPGGVDACYVS
jgi:hypothetical protein